MSKPEDSIEIILRQLKVAENFIALVGELCINNYPWTEQEIAEAKADDFANTAEGLASGRYKYRVAGDVLVPIREVTAEKRYIADAGTQLAHSLTISSIYFGYVSFVFKEDLSEETAVEECFWVDRDGHEENENHELFADITAKIRTAKTSGKLVLAKNQDIMSHPDAD